MMDACMNTVLQHRRPHRAEPKAVSSETFSSLINLAGRQRMLSQRIILNAILATQQHEEAVAVAEQALSLFETSHGELVHGSPLLPGVFFPTLHAIYFGEAQADKRIRAFILQARSAISALGTQAAVAEVEALGKQATPLVNLLNQITQVYEAEAKQHAHAQQKEHRALMGNIQQIAKQAKIVSVNAQIMAARAGEAGKEFSVVAGVLTTITGELDELIVSAMKSAQR
jgi:hypothetical protein